MFLINFKSFDRVTYVFVYIYVCVCTANNVAQMALLSSSGNQTYEKWF